MVKTHFLIKFFTHINPNFKIQPPPQRPSVPTAELGGGNLYSAGIEPLNRVQENLPLFMEALSKRTVLAERMA